MPYFSLDTSGRTTMEQYIEMNSGKVNLHTLRTKLNNERKKYGRRKEKHLSMMNIEQ